MTPAQQNDRGMSAEQRADTRVRLATGKLPPRSSKQKVYGGYGENQLCAICGRHIGKSDAAYEIELCEIEPYEIKPYEQLSQTHTLSMHYGCFAAWVAESGFLAASKTKAAGWAALSETIP
jgi:hypothetical protein